MDSPDQRKINMKSTHMRTRIKKYDTYHQRGIIHRSVVPSTNIHNYSKSNKISYSTDIKSSSEALHKSSISGFQQKPTTPIRHKSNQNVSTAPAKTVALRAVAEARIYENELYPDNEITMYSRAKRKLSLFQKALYGFGVIVLVFSAFVSVQSFINNMQAKEQVATLGANSTKDEQGVSEGTGDEPSEDEISQSAIYAYKPSNPEDPRYIRIPEIGVIARVKNLGTTPEGAVDAPKNINDAGWYNGSVRPGSARGSSLIVAHVSGWTAPGVFKNINKLAVGSVFEVEKGNGEKIKYSVKKKQQIPLDQVNMSEILGAEVAGQHDIKLMTCSGKYNKDTKTYEDRYVVYAKPVI